MGDEVREFLEKLKSLDADMYYYQRENIVKSQLVKHGVLDLSVVLQQLKAKLQHNETRRAPFQGLNVGDAKNMSYDELDKITNKFSDENFIGSVGNGRLFRGFMNDGERVREVAVKTWDFVFPSVDDRADYPRQFHDEIVLLERSELKSHPFFVKLIGFCFEKKLAVVYDLEFKRFLWNSLTPAKFGWKERMKVATNYAQLLKTFLSVRQFELICTSSDIMIDEEYNIKLVNFSVKKHGTGNGATASDDPSLMEKYYVFELGLLLLELMMKKVRSWDHMIHPGLYIARRGSSFVDETLVDAKTASEITQLIESCVHCEPAERPQIDCVFDNLTRIAGY